MEELRRLDSTKRWAIWKLILNLRKRHEGECFTELSDPTFCDPLNVEPDEIIALAKLVARARAPEGLHAHAAIATRLRLCGRPMSLVEFERLVLHGKIPRENRRLV